MSRRSERIANRQKNNSTSTQSQEIDQGTVKHHILPITQRGKQIAEVSYRRTKAYGRKEVASIVGSFRRRLLANPKIHGSLQVAVYIEGLGWRALSKMNIRDAPPLIFSLSDYADNFKTQYDDDSFRGFNLYFYKEGSTSGRTSAKGDCFFQCLRKVLPAEFLPFESDEKLKEYFRIMKSGGVDISLMPKIDKLTKKYAINVSGDHRYISTKDTFHKVHLLLENGHYTVDEKKTKIYKVKGVFKEERVPCVYRHEGNQVICHYYANGEYNCETVDRKTFHQIYDCPNGNKYKKIAPNPFLFMGNHSSEQPKEQLDDFIKDAEELKKATNGLVDLYKTGHFKKSALELFYSFNKGLEVDDIGEHEAHWLNMCNTGALIWATPYKGEGHLYDYVSRYPSIMNHKTFRFPIKAGTFKKIDNLDNITSTQSQRAVLQVNSTSGIYRVKISKVNPRLFRLNPTNYYTTTDIYRAKNMGGTVELIIDDQPNFLHYPPETMISGDKVFGKYIDLVYSLKEKKVRGAKKILNMLWGALCQKDYTRKMVDKDEPRDVTEEIDSIRPETDDKIYISTIKKEHQFSTPFARLQPFLLSKGRELLSRTMENHVDDIVRVHTDGFIVTHKLDIETGTTLGALKYEGYYPHCEVVNCQKVIGEFTKI